jgi:hypothetical protein
VCLALNTITSLVCDHMYMLQEAVAGWQGGSGMMAAAARGAAAT